MKKKILAVCLVVALVATLAISGTFAYLTDTDEAKNVMELGKVDIEQVEVERNEEGTLVDFQDDKLLYPITKDANRDGKADAYEGTVTVGSDSEAYDVFANDYNVLDKIVCVQNVGKSDAYVRTILAFEMKKNADGTWADPVNNEVMTVWGGRDYAGDVVLGDDGQTVMGCYWPTDAAGEYITFDLEGIRYIVCVFYYAEGSLLPAGETTGASLLQIYLKSNVGNEFYEACGDKYDILALSQATQIVGFDNAAEALDAAFGKVAEADLAAWFANVE